MRIRTFSGAFEAAGYRLTAPRSQWSAIKADGSAVALTIWADEIDKTSDPWECNLLDHPKLDVWLLKTGNSIRKRHIRHGIDHCNGRFDLILCRAVDFRVEPRKVESAKPWPERVGKITPADFRADTGEFRMVLEPRTIIKAGGSFR